MSDKFRFSGQNKTRCCALRREQTIAERPAWHLLRDRRTLGLKFRRQVAIDDFIVDFYCDELKLIVEIDGDVHTADVQAKRDIARDRRLKELGYTILRFHNSLVINDPDLLIQAIHSLRPSPGASACWLSRLPLPEGEGK